MNGYEITSPWYDDGGPHSDNLWQAWVWFEGEVLSPYWLQPSGLPCLCGFCLAGCAPPDGWGTLQVLYDGEAIAFDWDGRLWDYDTCADGHECARARPAPPGRYAVQFFLGHSYRHNVDYTDWRTEGWDRSPVISFQYPSDRIVWYEHDCSGLSADDPWDECR